MKLLFDENLSPRLVELLAADFPGCTHIEFLGMRGATDSAVWDHARENGYTIVSKDNDFRQRAFLHGPPPKVVWLSVGNTGTRQIAASFAQGADGYARLISIQAKACWFLKRPHRLNMSRAMASPKLQRASFTFE